MKSEHRQAGECLHVWRDWFHNPLSLTWATAGPRAWRLAVYTTDSNGETLHDSECLHMGEANDFAAACEQARQYARDILAAIDEAERQMAQYRDAQVPPPHYVSPPLERRTS